MLLNVLESRPFASVCVFLLSMLLSSWIVDPTTTATLNLPK